MSAHSSRVAPPSPRIAPPSAPTNVPPSPPPPPGPGSSPPWPFDELQATTRAHSETKSVRLKPSPPLRRLAYGMPGETLAGSAYRAHIQLLRIFSARELRERALVERQRGAALREERSEHLGGRDVERRVTDADAV